MSTLTSYNGLQVVTPDPTGGGGLAINNNFKALSTRIGQSNYTATRDPLATDNASVPASAGGPYTQGSRWINTTTSSEFVCVASSTSSATWQKTTLLASSSTGEINIAMPNATTPAISIQAAASATALSFVVNDSTGSPRIGVDTSNSTFYIYAAAGAYYAAFQPANFLFARPGANYFSAVGSGGSLVFQTQNTAVSGAQNRLQIAAGDLATMYLTATIVNQTFTNVATSGSQVAWNISPTYNQASGTAGNTDLYINRTETAIGSGTQRLIDARVGGNTKFSIQNTGRAFVTTPNSANTDSDLANNQITFYLDETNNNLKVRVKYSDGTLKTGTVALS